MEVARNRDVNSLMNCFVISKLDMSCLIIDSL